MHCVYLDRPGQQGNGCLYKLPGYFYGSFNENLERRLEKFHFWGLPLCAVVLVLFCWVE